MKNKTMAILFASNSGCQLNDLTIHRTAASLPFAGRYRLIDFILSNLVEAGVSNVGIVTRSNYNSLMDHLRNGRDWDLNRKNSGISIYPPFVLNASRDAYKGKIEALKTVRGFMLDASENYVILSNTNIALNINFDDVEEEHLATNADITMLTYNTEQVNAQREVITTNAEGRIIDMRSPIAADVGEKNVNLQIYLVKKDLLISLIDEAHAHGSYDFEKDIMAVKLNELNVHNYVVKDYVAVIDKVQTYFSHSMKVLNPAIRDELFYKNTTILTKVKDSVPTKYLENANVKNSIIADGCVIDGTVENSILFRSVNVQKGAVIKNSIVMENNIIMENSQLEYCITDKDVIVQANRKLSGAETYPLVIVKGKII